MRLQSRVIAHRWDFGLVAALLGRAGTIRGRPDVVAERLLVAQPAGETSQRIRLDAEKPCLLDEAEDE